MVRIIVCSDCGCDTEIEDEQDDLCPDCLKEEEKSIIVQTEGI